jgi:hypothetical protein
VRARKPGPWPSQSVTIILADVEYEAEVEWFGTYSRATHNDPQEFPEPYLVSCKRDGIDYPLDYLTVEAEEKLLACAYDSAEDDPDPPEYDYDEDDGRAFEDAEGRPHYEP